MRRAVTLGKPFPLVLLDAMMPGMDGFLLAEKIKNDPDLAGSVIMMLSSAGQPGDAARCRALGVANYLTKPVTQSDLLKALTKALDSPLITPTASTPPPPFAPAPVGNGNGHAKRHGTGDSPGAMASPPRDRCASSWPRTMSSTRRWRSTF